MEHNKPTPKTHSNIITDIENEDSELEHQDVEENQVENLEENLEENLLIHSITTRQTTSPTQSSSTPHPHLTRSSSFSSPSITDRVALFNSLAKSPLKKKKPAQNQDAGNLMKALENLREQIVERIEDSLEIKVNNLKQSLEEYRNKLEKT